MQPGNACTLAALERCCFEAAAVAAATHPATPSAYHSRNAAVGQLRTRARQASDKSCVRCALHAIALRKRSQGRLDHNLGCCSCDSRTGAAPHGIKAAIAQVAP